ncbi:MAG: hypothetical protein QOD65_1072 [Gaiellales bacterium]|jgi:NAD(P)-dependent dehydrogenase (short-subunit alcohol dehydrogenase family)|nr:hypothetical protein [Gaiellales bacterium]
MELEGRRILVTGASSGIGRAVAQVCVEAGARVLATGRRAEALDELDGVRRYVCDLRDPGAPAACVAEGVALLGGLDGVVHAAGTVIRGQDPRGSSDEEIDGILLDNLAVPQRVARAALAALGRGGSLVLLSSQLAHIGAPGYSSYCAAKGGVEALVRSLAVDVGPDGIRVNAVAPGLVQTPMAYYGRENFDELVPAIAERHPLRRIGQAEDIAGPVAFLLSDASSWMTGQTIVVDGGYTIQ